MCKNLEKVLAFHCAPALFGLKSSNLVNCSLKEFPNIVEDIQVLNQEYSPRLYFYISGICEKRALILVCQRHKLYNTIFKPNNQNYLQNQGYPLQKDLDLYLSHLRYKVEESKEFPHEIGVFLGYDLNDIIDFNQGDKECLYVGYWKVFSNKEEKIKVFERFTKCREILFQLLQKGYSLESMI